MNLSATYTIILFVTLLSCKEVKPTNEVKLTDSGVITEGTFIYKKPKITRSGFSMGNDKYIFLSAEESLLIAQKDSSKKLTIVDSYSIPDSIWKKAQSIFYANMKDKMKPEWVDSMNNADEILKEAKSLIYNFGYDPNTKQTQILCAFACPYQVVKTSGTNRYNMTALHRPMYILTLDSSMKMQKLSFFSTDEIMESGGALGAVFGLYYKGDTMLIPEVVKESDKKTELPLYSVYVDEKGVFKKKSVSEIQFNSKNNIAAEGYTQRFSASFSINNSSLLMTDYRNLYDLDKSKLLYTLPSSYNPTSRILDMAINNDNIAFIMTDLKSKNKADSAFYLTTVNLKTNQVNRVKDISKLKYLYAIIPKGKKILMVFGENEEVKYEEYEIN